MPHPRNWEITSLGLGGRARWLLGLPGSSLPPQWRRSASQGDMLQAVAASQALGGNGFTSTVLNSGRTQLARKDT